MSYGDVPIRWGAGPAPPGDGVFQTIRDPNNNYPQPTAGNGIPNVYYAQRCSVSFDDEQGTQGFSPSPRTGNSNKKYICNMGDAYIGLGQAVSCRQIGSQFYCEEYGPQLYFGTTQTVPLPGSAGYGTVPVTVTQISGVSTVNAFTCGFTMQSPYPIPNNWPVIGIAKNGQVWHLKEYPLTQPAYLQNYLVPFGVGSAVLVGAPNTWSNSTVQVVDTEGMGAQPIDQTVMLQYTNIPAGVYDGQVPTAGWIITSASCCNGEGM
jgi:hypothetical protein